MNRRQARRLIAALSSATIAGLLLRRRIGAQQTLPAFEEEQIVLPMGNFVPEAQAGRQDGDMAQGERMTRKVGSNRRISVGGKLYGPLDQELVGQQVEVEERDDKIVVYSNGNEAGTFDREL